MSKSIHRVPRPGPGASAPDRRTFLGLAGLVALGPARPPSEAEAAPSDDDAWAVLVDTTRCMGCRSCVAACAEAHDLPGPAGYQASTSTAALSVIDRHETDDEKVDIGNVFVKRQCMHCLQPACAAACLTKALIKTEEGPVVWRASKCMGCRYCMVSCPFDVPKFEYDSPVPRIAKCDLCAQRLVGGELPACVEACPMEALTFGRRRELLFEAHRRIAEDPGLYVDHVYGEHEAGGTSVLYLSALPFGELGLPERLGEESYPSLTKEFLYGVPVVLTLVPAFLLALSNATRRPQPLAERGDEDDHGAGDEPRSR